MKFTFKNKEDYQNQRAELMAKAEDALTNGKTEEANTFMEDVKTMDTEFQNYSQMQANFNALNGINNQIPSGIPLNGIVDSIGNADGETDIYNSFEYRNAFRDYVMKNTAIPAKFTNTDANTKTTDVGVIIPTTVIEKIIDKLENTGRILSLVTRTSYKGGVKIPINGVKPTATWTAEGSGSDKQKMDISGSVSFTMHKLRCAVSVTLETDTASLAVFEKTLIENISTAMVKALETSIITGSGTNCPKGILSETVPDGQNIDIAPTKSITYADLCKAEAALPEEYENTAKWFMSKKTFMEFVGIVDSNGQPIARVNYGIGGKPERYLLGREVIVNPYTPTYTDTVTADTKFAFIFSPEDYVLNTNLDITIKKYEDNATDDIVTKGIMLVDGKATAVYSLVTMTKKKASS